MAKSHMSDEQLASLLKNLKSWLSSSDQKAARDVAMKRGGRTKKRRRYAGGGQAPGAAAPTPPAGAQTNLATAANAAGVRGPQAPQMPQYGGQQPQPQQAQSQVYQTPVMPTPLQVRQQPQNAYANLPQQYQDVFAKMGWTPGNGDGGNPLIGMLNSMRFPGGGNGLPTNVFKQWFDPGNADPNWGTRWGGGYGMYDRGPPDRRQHAAGGATNDAASNALRIAQRLR